MRAVFPMRSDAETMTSRAFRGRAVIHVEDVLADPRYQVEGYRAAGGLARRPRGADAPWRRSVIGVIFV